MCGSESTKLLNTDSIPNPVPQHWYHQYDKKIFTETDLKNGLEICDGPTPGAGVILAGGHEGHHQHRQPHQQGLHQRAVRETNVVVRNTT